MAKDRINVRVDGALMAALDSMIGIRGEDRSGVVVNLLRDGVIASLGGTATDSSDEKLANLENILTDIQSRLTNIEQSTAHPSHEKKHPPVQPPKPVEVGTVLLKSDAAIAAGYPGQRGGLSPWVQRRGYDNSEAWLQSMGWVKESGYRWRYEGIK